MQLLQKIPAGCKGDSLFSGGGTRRFQREMKLAGSPVMAHIVTHKTTVTPKNPTETSEHLQKNKRGQRNKLKEPVDQPLSFRARDGKAPEVPCLAFLLLFTAVVAAKAAHIFVKPDVRLCLLDE